MRKLVVALLALMIFSIAGQSLVLAQETEETPAADPEESGLSPEQRQLLNYGVYYYDPNDICSTSSQGTEGTIAPGATPGPVVLIGDSLSDPNWPGTANAKLQQQFSAGGWSLTIDSVAGRRASQAVPRINANSAQIAAANAVVVQLGSNPDTGNFGNQINPIINAIKSINEEARIFWVDVGSNTNGTGKDGTSLAGILDVDAQTPAAYSAINEKIHTLSTTNNYTVIPWFKTVFPDGDPKAINASWVDSNNYLDNDKLHLSPEGSTRFATLIGDYVKGGGGQSVPTSNASVDPQALQIFQDELLPLITPLVPLYQQAAQEEGLLDWQLLPALHNLEFGLRRDNPTTNLGFKSPFQMSQTGLSAGGVDTSAEIFAPGRVLSDEEFVTVARYAIRFYLKPNGDHLGIDLSGSLTPEEAGKLVASYKSGAYSVWFTGAADFNLHAYAWAGFDTTPEHILPMAWGPGSPFGDEVAGTRVSKPGAATVFVLLKGGSYAPTNTCTEDGELISGGTTLTPITGSREELVERALSSPNLNLGNYGPASTQTSDIESVISEKLLIAIVAMVEQSGSPVPVNAIKSDHGAGTLHELGRAIDIGYYGHGNPAYSAEGERLFKFLHDNYTALGGEELIWQEPPPGYQCGGASGLGDCYSIYGTSIMNQHYHHIHFAVKE